MKFLVAFVTLVSVAVANPPTFDSPISVGPAIVGDYSPIQVGPAIIDESAQASSSSPLVQIIINVKPATGPVRPPSAKPEEIRPEDVINMDPIIIDHMPEDAPIVGEPVVGLPDPLN